MRTAGRLTAAIEVLAEVLERHRPAAEALKDWGRAHRFAGSGDRAAIGNLVYDALRRKGSLAARMGSDSPRALGLAAAAEAWGLAPGALAALGSEQHGPGALTDEEQAALAAEPRHGSDIPDWLMRSFARVFGDHAAAEGDALSRRAPVDLRANTLKASRDKVMKALAKFEPAEGPLSPWCVRLPAPAGSGRSPDVEAEPAHAKGWFEVQDEGSQVAALLAGARAGMQVADICAGAGGKTLALAAAMDNKGQIHAWDSDRHRLRPIFERLQRAAARNVQVIPADETARLDALAGRMDIVFADAPCSGSGAWRRKPDSKWRLTERALEQRLAEQRDVLERGAALVKPGGRLVYVTCSVLPEENGKQAAAFLAAHPDFRLLPYRDAWLAAIGTPAPGSADGATDTLQLTPASHGTDGFFIAVLQRG